jgi:HEAT repeat protein
LVAHTVENAIWLKQNDFNQQFLQALPEAKEHLVKLAQLEEWWVRLYVVEIMRRHRELCQPEVLQEFGRDPNALVRKAAKSALP